MAYTHSKYEVVLAVNHDLTDPTDDVIKWAPGYIPHYIRAIQAVVTTDVVDGDGVVYFYKDTTANPQTTLVATLKMGDLSPVAAGKVIYLDGLNILVAPGEEITSDNDPEGVTGIATFTMYVEPTWELPANNSAMVATA